MGSDIEDAIKNTMKALRTDDLIMAQEVINKDCIIDDAERTIENLCLKLLLTQQPVATDMRMISSALKMITDMERIGDFAADIAEIITKGGRTGTSYNIDFVDRMGEAVIRMVDSAVLSFTNTDLTSPNRSARRTTKWTVCSTAPKTLSSTASERTNNSPNAPSI